MSIAGEDTAEEMQVICNAACQDGICAGCEIDGAAGGVLALEVVEERGVPGQMGNVEVNVRGYIGLECGFALAQHSGQAQGCLGVLADEDEEGVDERVAFYEGSVEVHTEGA